MFAKNCFWMLFLQWKFRRNTPKFVKPPIFKTPEILSRQNYPITGEGESVQNLLKAAIEARKKSYSPYSNFAVGSAIVTEEDNKIYTGCNVESATATPTVCAERTAIGKAVSEGYLKIKAVAVIAHQNAFTAPCGVCRQTLSEFRSSNGDIDIYLSKPGLEQVLCTTISQLLPLAYVSHREDSIPS